MKMNEIVRCLFLVPVRYFKRSVLFFIKERLVSFVNELKINVSFRSLTESSVNFQKLPFVNGTLPSPKYTAVPGSLSPYNDCTYIHIKLSTSFNPIQVSRGEG